MNRMTCHRTDTLGHIQTVPLTEHIKPGPGTLSQAGFDLASTPHSLLLSGTGPVDGSEMKLQRRWKVHDVHFSDLSRASAFRAVAAVRWRTGFHGWIFWHWSLGASWRVRAA